MGNVTQCCHKVDTKTQMVYASGKENVVRKDGLTAVDLFLAGGQKSIKKVVEIILVCDQWKTLNFPFSF